jgi:hypothetical protein
MVTVSPLRLVHTWREQQEARWTDVLAERILVVMRRRQADARTELLFSTELLTKFRSGGAGRVFRALRKLERDRPIFRDDMTGRCISRSHYSSDDRCQALQPLTRGETSDGSRRAGLGRKRVLLALCGALLLLMQPTESVAQTGKFAATGKIVAVLAETKMLPGDKPGHEVTMVRRTDAITYGDPVFGSGQDGRRIHQ